MYNLGLDIGTRILFFSLISLVDGSQILEFCIYILFLKGSNMFKEGSRELQYNI